MGTVYRTGTAIHSILHGLAYAVVCVKLLKTHTLHGMAQVKAKLKLAGVADIYFSSVSDGVHQCGIECCAGLFTYRCQHLVV